MPYTTHESDSPALQKLKHAHRELDKKIDREQRNLRPGDELALRSLKIQRSRLKEQIERLMREEKERALVN